VPRSRIQFFDLLTWMFFLPAHWCHSNLGHTTSEISILSLLPSDPPSWLSVSPVLTFLLFLTRNLAFEFELGGQEAVDTRGCVHRFAPRHTHHYCCVLPLVCWGMACLYRLIC
jgi:hypothetical protein